MKKNIPVPAVIAIVVVLLVGLFAAYQYYSADHVYTGSKKGYGADSPPPMAPPSAPPAPAGGAPTGQ